MGLVACTDAEGSVMRKTYDEASYQLACDFLEDDERFQRLPPALQAHLRVALARAIQDVIDDFLEYEI